MNERLTVGTETYAPQPLRFNGAVIEQARDYTICVSMQEYARSISRLDIDRPRRKQPDAQATPLEIRAYQALAGKMNWLGHTLVPHYSFAASYLQQNLRDLRVKHISQANGALREAQKNAPFMIFGRMRENMPISLCAFADAALPKISGSTSSQTGIICGLVQGTGTNAAFHPIAWVSHKQSRVCRSASAAEIMAIAEAQEFGGALKIAVERVYGRAIPFELNVDSRSLFDSITTQHETKDFRLRQAVRSLRESYEAGELSTLRWIAGKFNPADALTKRGASTAPLLSKMCCTGRLSVDFTLGLESTDAHSA